MRDKNQGFGGAGRGQTYSVAIPDAPFQGAGICVLLPSRASATQGQAEDGRCQGRTLLNMFLKQSMCLTYMRLSFYSRSGARSVQGFIYLTPRLGRARPGTRAGRGGGPGLRAKETWAPLFWPPLTSHYPHLETWRRGDVKTWRRGDVETWRRGDVETWRRGDVETWRRGDVGTRTRYDTDTIQCGARRYNATQCFVRRYGYDTDTIR